MHNEMKTLILAAIDLKISSVKRAQKSNTSPNFAPVYDKELSELNKARDWIVEQKTTSK